MKKIINAKIFNTSVREDKIHVMYGEEATDVKVPSNVKKAIKDELPNHFDGMDATFTVEDGVWELLSFVQKVKNKKR